MIEKMTRYSFILMNDDKTSFLNSLQGLGVVDITRSARPVDRTSEIMMADIESKKAEIAGIEKGSDAHLETLKSRLSALRKERESLLPWGSYDRNALQAIGLPVQFYSVQTKKYDASWEEGWAVQKTDERDDKTFFVIIGDAEGFSLKEIPAPERSLEDVDSEISGIEVEIERYVTILEDCRNDLPALRGELSALRAKLNRYLAELTGTPAAESRLVVFEGFAPTAERESLEAALDLMDAVYVADDATVEDNPPIKLRNNRFVKMFEVLTDMYGRPAYDGFDPTPYISLFFLLFFAMCIGDLGYGIILMIIGLLLKKADSFRSLSPLVVTLGAGTVLVGFFFHTFFSVDISQWEWIPEGLRRIMVPATIAGYDGSMVVALVVGVIHLLLAMIVKTVYATRNKGFLNSLSTWGWTVFWVGLTIIGVAALAGVMDKGVTRFAIIVLGVVCAIGIFPLNNLKRNPLVNIGSGLWDSYNMATGILGDVLSYLRLYALGLAGAMLGFAFNELASMTLGDSWYGWIPFILIVIVGHTLNIAMAALGAFVHPLRLNFLEFFKNSDYNGNGLKYNPLNNSNQQ